MSIFSPFKKNNSDSGAAYFDDSNRVARIFYRLSSYNQIFWSSINKGIPAIDLLRSQFPYSFKDAIEPPIVALELTNYCNLKCPYCTNVLGQRTKGFMSNAVFERLLTDLNALRPNRIQLVGNGESTLHPRFGEYITKLADTGKYVSLVTNGQWVKESIAEEVLSAPLDLIEFSIDAGGKEGYELSRINGSFEVLLANLNRLKELKRKFMSKTMINIRVMLRPSQKESFMKESAFWKQYADRVMPQYINKINNTEYQDDVFIPIQKNTGEFPKCSMPFKHLEIKYTGQVLMCYYTLYQVGVPGLVIGNVLETTIKDLWNCQIMKDYRMAHRNRLKEKMPVCKGCPGT